MADTATLAINAPGWADLSSSDPEASRAFYTQLFGWTAEVVPDPQAGGYGMFKLDGKDTAGVGPLQDQQTPSHWLPYILVNDAAATTEKARQAGATIIVEPMDVMGAGTMVILTDPSGAFIGLWQPGEHRGFGVQNVPGSFAWIELNSRDFPAARSFYTQVFGWSTKEGDMGEGMTYTEFQLDGTSIAGGMPTPPMVPAEIPSHWLVYFGVEDVDARTGRAGELGASELMAPSDFPGGRFSIVQDPQGAAFGLLNLQRS